MSIRRKALNVPPIDDPWVDPNWIARKYSVSYQTGLRWILRLTGDDLTRADGQRDNRRKRGTRPYRMRRVPLSVLEAHIDELLNG
jgi:hypothetical protein